MMVVMMVVMILLVRLVVVVVVVVVVMRVLMLLILRILLLIWDLHFTGISLEKIWKGVGLRVKAQHERELYSVSDRGENFEWIDICVPAVIPSVANRNIKKGRFELDRVKNKP